MRGEDTQTAQEVRQVQEEMTIPKVEVLPIEEGATTDPLNLNKHTQRGGGLLENSLRKRGAFRSIASAGKGVKVPVVMAGNFTLEKAVSAGFTEVVNVHVTGNQIVNVVRDDLEPNSPEAIALGLEDNEIGKQSYNPDLDILAAVMADPAMQALKAEDKILAGIVEGMGLPKETKDAEPQIDRAAELQEKWQTASGQLWQLGKHRLLIGDCTVRENVERLMGGESADLVLTDPPYAVDYGAKNRALQSIAPSNRLEDDIAGDNLSVEETAKKLWSPAFENAYNASRNGTVIYCFSPQGGDQMMMMMMMMMKAKWNERLHQLIWRKNSPTFSMGRLDYQYQHEPVLYSWRGTNHGYYGETGRSIIDCDRPSASKLHPTMKPVELFEIFIKNSSRNGELIYEPFAGSGTTIIAAQNLSRRCYAMEISEKYGAVILERFATAFPAEEIKRLE